jgi:SPP1 family predicted phage head-tail adaptor
VRAGLLRHRITIERPTETLTTLGEPVQSWTPVATIWVSVEHRDAGERFSDGRIFSERRTRFGGRWLISGVTTPMRVNFGGRLFDLTSVDDLEERHRELVLWGIERVV